MFGFTRKHGYNEQECYKHIANSVLSISKDEKIKIFGFISTSNKKDFLNNIIGKLSSSIAKKDVNTLVINASFDDENSKFFKDKFNSNNLSLIESQNIPADQFRLNLLELSKKYDLILISINFITSRAEALEYTKTCEEITIIEKCTECYYSDYENMLINLKSTGIIPRGVITVS